MSKRKTVDDPFGEVYLIRNVLSGKLYVGRGKILSVETRDKLIRQDPRSLTALSKELGVSITTVFRIKHGLYPNRRQAA